MAFLDTLEKTYAARLRGELDITRSKFTALMGLLSDSEWEKYLDAIESKNPSTADAVLQAKINAYLGAQAREWRQNIEVAGTISITELEALWAYRSNGNG